MAEIARKAGISHTGLLHHFPRKEDLLTAVLDLQDERAEQYLSAHDARSPDSDPADVLREVVTVLLERNRTVGLVELGAVLTGEATALSHPAHDYFTRRYAQNRRFLTRLFSELRRQGRLTSALTPETLAATTIAVLDGLNTQWLFDRDSVDVETMSLAHLSTFVAELAPPARAHAHVEPAADQ
jgi:AcrR family transcriptional regulator